jgi:hypothetical protein
MACLLPLCTLSLGKPPVLVYEQRRGPHLAQSMVQHHYIHVHHLSWATGKPNLPACVDHLTGQRDVSHIVCEPADVFEP